MRLRRMATDDIDHIDHMPALLSCRHRQGGGDVADLERLFATAIKRFGQFDIVVANAGIEQVDRPIADVAEADFDKLYGVNAKGAFFTLQLAGKHVVDNGRILYIGSSTTSFPTPGHGL